LAPAAWARCTRRTIHGDRVVAIKLSAERFGERFEREARAVASLNHPNICQLHDVGPNYLVMELVEGPTLGRANQRGNGTRSRNRWRWLVFEFSFLQGEFGLHFSFWEGEYWKAMTEVPSQAFRARLAEKLADSLAGPLPDMTLRRVHGAVSLPNKATAVIGMRRVGKTTFLNQLRRERLQRGVARERLPYLNLEDEQLAGLNAKDLGLALEEYYRRFPALRRAETVTWCLDEVQVVPGWERFVRRVLDSENVEIFLSGSSAALLSRELATAMRGRAWEVVIHPFSFEEYLRHHRQPVPPRPEFVPAAERSALERAFLEYLAIGGFPEAQGLDAATR
jgi:hypothetical protein